MQQPELGRISGRFLPGLRYSPDTEFKNGQHWRQCRAYWDPVWLRREYSDNKKSAHDIAKQFGITENAIPFWIKKHGIPTRTISEIRKVKRWGSPGKSNPMFGKRGPLNPNWAGGHTPFRQSLYAKVEWQRIARYVKKRDPVCRLCGGDGRLEIHHIEQIADLPLLALEESNLIRLCQKCHMRIRGQERRWRRRLTALIPQRRGGDTNGSS